MTRRFLLVLIAAAAVMSVAMGIRQSFGLFLAPLALDRGLALTWFAVAIALHNLVWGLAQPVAGAAADRYGATPVVVVGCVVVAAGLAVTALARSPAGVLLGLGLLIGLGLSCVTHGPILGAIGRAVPAARRSQALGLAAAGGSLGQVAIVPWSQGSIGEAGVTWTLAALAVLMLCMAPVGLAVERRAPASVPSRGNVTLRQALEEAWNHRGFLLLTAGFFTCGFQLAFITTHLPNYLELCGLSSSLAANALAMIGLLNVVGTLFFGWLGARVPPQYCLAALYLVRGAALAVFALIPPTPTTVTVFAAVMGVVWLATAPLTSGLVARMFGVQHLGALFGITFLSHQIGSFLGASMGGVVFDLTGSYAVLWALTAAAGVMAAAFNLPIKEGLAPRAA